MKPIGILNILDIAWAARKMGKVFNPCFVGEAGLGKSEIIQQWVKKQQERNPDFFFLDLRLVYFEGPDFIGFPYEEKDSSGRVRTNNALPAMWPTDEHAEGLILFEEPNRGTTMVQNALMQLTDKNRSIGADYKLPEGVIMAAAINPEGSNYDVNAMDSALKNRFEMFNIEYHHPSFMQYATVNNGWHYRVVDFLKSNIWVYKSTDELAEDGTYISPRTMSRLSNSEHALDQSGKIEDRDVHGTIVRSILGKNVGSDYFKFCYDNAPVKVADILKNKKRALEKLKRQCSADNYAGDQIEITVTDIIENYQPYFKGAVDNDGKVMKKDRSKIDEATMVEVAKIIPADQTYNMIKGCAHKVDAKRMKEFFSSLKTRHPDLVKILKASLKLENNQAKK